MGATFLTYRTGKSSCPIAMVMQCHMEKTAVLHRGKLAHLSIRKGKFDRQQPGV